MSTEAKDFLNTTFQYKADARPTAEEMFSEPWMMLPINEKYSTGSSTAVGVNKSASQSSEEIFMHTYQPKLFLKRTNKLREAERTQPQEKIKSKLYVLSNSPKKNELEVKKGPTKIKIPKSLIAPAKGKGIKELDSVKIKDLKNATGPKPDEKHYHLHLYHHL